MVSGAIQFVDSISASATLRLDINSSPWSVLSNGTLTPPPPMRRSISQNFLVDGATIPASAYDNRLITLALQIRGVSPGAAATQIQLLNRELNRDQNILKWQPDSTTPAQYFRTFRSPDYEYNPDYGVGIHNFSIPLVAEPFGYGVEEVVNSSLQVFNDPAAAALTPMLMDITGVKGDVDTPLYLRTATSLAGYTCLLASRRRGTPGSGTWFVQAESVTQGTDTAVTGSTDALASGSGNNYAITTFSTVSTGADRLSGVWPSSSASAELRGTYHVYARVRKSATGSVMKAALTLATGTIVNGSVTVPDTTTWTYLDLGLMELPAGSQGQTDGFGAALAAIGVQCAIRYSRTSGSGSLYTDNILFLPADQELGQVFFPTTPAGPGWVMDGPNDESYIRGTTGTPYTVGATADVVPIYQGGLPFVGPNVTNRIFFVMMEGAKSLTPTFYVSYWPRYLTMRPVST